MLQSYYNKSMARNAVPLLLTMDLEIAPDYDLVAQAEILDVLREDWDRQQISVTIFVTADAAERFSDQIRRLRHAGHEIGCHGVAHSIEENYRQMGTRQIEDCLDNATARIADVTGTRPVCFRGPRMTTSAATQRCLIDRGYRADFSVCPQRADILTCVGGDMAWLKAPRVPYRPSASSPYRKGELPLWVIPSSSLGLPFISGTAYLFGLTTARLLYRMLLGEGRRQGNSIVYLFHSYEFTKRLDAAEPSARPFHHRLYTRRPERRLTVHHELVSFMLAQDDIIVLTASKYIAQFLEGPHAH